MSIRKKVIISNVLSFIVPVIVAIFAIYMGITAIDNKFNSSYYIDYYEKIDKIEESMRLNNIEDILEYSKDIEENGVALNIISHGKSLYSSKDYKEYFENITNNTFEDILIETFDGNTYMVKNDVGELNVINFEDSDDFIILINKEPLYSLEEQGAMFKDDILFISRVVILGILAVVVSIIVTTSLTTYITLNSIIKPLNLLEKGTNEIIEGNLDFQLNYEENNEFGELFDDFEAMRVKLLKSREDEKRYSDNRNELIAGITHDLNTPLTSIKGYTSGLLEGVANTKDKQIHYLNQINSISREMSELINELLLYSTLDLDKVKFNFIKTDLVEYFNDCIFETKDRFEDKGMKIKFTSYIDKAFVKLDILHFKRVVLNILNNSLKYKKNDLVNMDISLDESEWDYVISFRDDGIGVSDEDIGRLFDVSYRTDKSRSKENGGYGLGLAIVYSIVDSHNGTIGINEKYKEGLELVIKLPKIEGEIVEENIDNRR